MQTQIDGVVRYHRPHDGCIVNKIRVEGTGESMIRIYKCLTHNRETCHCGMEWGHHRAIQQIMIDGGYENK